MAYSFTSWVRRRKRIDGLMPEADKVLPLIAAAGSTGMARGQIGHAVDLSPEALDEFLAGLVRLGVLRLDRENGLMVYRTHLR